MTEVLSVADIDLAELDAVGAGHGRVRRPAAPGRRRCRIEPLEGGDGVTGEIVVSCAVAVLGYDGLWATNDQARSFDGDGTEWHRTGDVGHVDAEGRLWVEGRLVHVVWTVDGPVTPCRWRCVLESAIGSRCAVTGVGPEGCQQVVVVVEADGKAGLAAGAVERRRADGARAPAGRRRPAASPKLPVDRRHNSKIDRTRLGRLAEKVLAGGGRRGGSECASSSRAAPGLLGRTTIAALAARGHEVVALQRNRSAAARRATRCSPTSATRARSPRRRRAAMP